VDKWPSRMQGQWFFLKSGKRATIFGQVLENLDFLEGWLPLPESTSHDLFVGEELTSSNVMWGSL
jgi:hypothetical protein